MMDKYIVEIDGNNICSDSDGKSKLALSVKADNGYAVFCTEIPLTPYTEPDMEQVRKEAYDTAYADAEEIYESGKRAMYQKGLKDAWEAAKKLWDLKGEIIKIFRKYSVFDILDCYTASEAVEKIRQYEQGKDRQARIEYNFDEIKDVLETTAKECNVSLDEIAEVLAKMKETE